MSGTRTEEAYRELITYADHAELSVKECFPKCWALLEALGVKRSKDDKDSDDYSGNKEGKGEK
jgi:hypothetical protein